MKRKVLCLLLALALLAGLALPAMAAGPGVEVTVHAGEGVYTVRYEAGDENANARFSLLVLRDGASPTAPGAVLYAAQADADEGGTVEFPDVRLRVDCSARFLVSGGTMAAPAETLVSVPGTAVLGSAVLHGRADHSGATVIFTSTDLDSGKRYTAKTRYDGSFMTDALPAGTYTVTVEADGYRTGVFPGVTLGGEDFSVLAAMELYVQGDVNQDKRIDRDDVAALLADFGKREGLVHPGADINGDGYVNGADLSLLVESLAQVPDKAPIKPPRLSVSALDGDKDGAYTLRLTTQGNSAGQESHIYKRMEAMVSWDSTLLTLADGNGDSIDLRDGSNQADYPGVLKITDVQSSEGFWGGAAFYRQDGRDACYVALASGAGELMVIAELNLRLKEGKTEADFYKGAIRVETGEGFLSRVLPAGERYGALLGYGGMVNYRYPGDGFELAYNYPNKDRQILCGLSIRAERDALAIPTGDGTQGPVELPLTAVGLDTEGDDMTAPSNLTWTLTSAPAGVGLTERHVLTASAAARSGSAVVRVEGSGFAVEKAFTISQEIPEPASIRIYRGGTALGATDTVKAPASGSRTYAYSASLVDQYGADLALPEGAEPIRWRFETADEKAGFQDGTLRLASGAAGTYRLAAVFEGLERTVSIAVSTESGGSIGGGGGGTVTPPEPAVTVTGGKSGTAVRVEAVKGADGAYTAALDKAAAEAILKAAAEKPGAVTITPVVGEAGAGAALVLPEALAQGLAQDQKGLTLVLPAASVDLTAALLSGLKGALTVSVKPSEAGRVAVVLNAGGTEVAAVNGGLTVRLDAGGQSGGGLTALLVGEDGNAAPIAKSVLLGSEIVIPLTGSAVLELRDNSKKFADMEGNWAQDSVDFVSARELFSGTGQGTFSPAMEMDRAMAVTVLYRLEGEPGLLAGAPSYTDVPGDAWYAAGAAWAASSGVAGGKGGGRFDPDGAVTREELALMLYRLADPAPEEPLVELHGYADSGEVSPWAAEAVAWAVSKGLLNGRSGGRLAPGDTATRAEVAALLERFIKLPYGEGGTV